jgi:putative ABC transport system permease protein
VANVLGYVLAVGLVVVLLPVLLALRTQLSSVLERRRDIGILKAIGWTNRDVVSQILAESVLQALLGGVLACLLGFLFLSFVPVEAIGGPSGVAKYPIGVPPQFLLLGMAIALAGGVIAGVVPAMIAARQRPADALRNI